MTVRWILPLVAAGMAASGFSQITMTTNVTDGQKLSGVFEFTARVQSKSVVSNVEFYINDDLRGTDESTPYQFKFDTIEEKEGPMKVSFHAYNSDGESIKKTFTVNIDNGLGKGLEFHVNHARELITDSKFDEAIVAGRIALKIDSTSADAMLVMARAYFGKGVYDISQKLAEDVLAKQPKNSEALSLMTAISLRQAFTSSGPDAISTIKGAIINAAESQRKVLEMRADAAGSPTKDNLLSWADTMLASHRYSIVASELKNPFESDLENADLANRMLYAQLRLGRYDDVLKNIGLMEKYGAPDGYTYTVKAIALQATGQTQASEEAEKEALLSNPGDLSTKFAQAYLAITRARYDVLNSFITELNKQEPSSSRTNYYKAIYYHLARDFDANRRAMELALLADPANYDMYVERGNEVIESAVSQKLSGDSAKDKYKLALAYFEAALAARPESFEALTGMSIAHNLIGNIDDAIKYGKLATRSAPSYAAGHYALAAAYRRNNTASGFMQDAQAAKDAAGKADSRLAGVIVPQPLVAWEYFFKRGRVPVIPPPASVSE